MDFNSPVGFENRATHRVCALSTMQRLMTCILVLAVGAATCSSAWCPNEQPDGHIALVQRHAKVSQVEDTEDKGPGLRDVIESAVHAVTQEHDHNDVDLKQQISSAAHPDGSCLGWCVADGRDWHTKCFFKACGSLRFVCCIF